MSYQPPHKRGTALRPPEAQGSELTRQEATVVNLRALGCSGPLGSFFYPDAQTVPRIHAAMDANGALSWAVISHFPHSGNVDIYRNGARVNSADNRVVAFFAATPFHSAAVFLTMVQGCAVP